MELIRQMLAVSGVLLLLAAALWWLRRRGMARFGGSAGPQRSMQAVERLALGPQHALHLVRLGGRGLLVGVSPDSCTLLESFEWASIQTAASKRHGEDQ